MEFGRIILSFIRLRPHQIIVLEEASSIETIEILATTQILQPEAKSINTSVSSQPRERSRGKSSKFGGCKNERTFRSQLGISLALA